MLGSLIALALIASVVVLPLVWSIRVDRRREEALKLQARLQRTADQRLGGESYLVVTVEPALAGQRGRVLLSAPESWRGLVDEVWKDVHAATPAGYDLVVPAVPGHRGRTLQPAPLGKLA
jgi:hypothetical protein